MRRLLPLLFRLAPGMTYEFIRKQLGTTVPFARHVGVSIEVIEKGRAVANLPFKPEGLNHIGTQHAGALYTLGEAASGAAMAGAFATVLTQIRPVAAEASIRYLAVAKGAVRAEASIAGDADALVLAVKTTGKAVFNVLVTMTGDDLMPIAEMTVGWHVSMKRT
jgi:uncharacterized protein (TIGR00369 family)